MPIYKGIETDKVLMGIVRHMEAVEDYREVLGKLQGAWDTLTLLGQLTGAAAEMSGTREAFQQLTGNLLNHLGLETRNKAVADLRAKVKNSINILVRNLFERTADIGFLCADDDIREFMQSPRTGRSELEKRFREYVDKYSVYSDIVLFDTKGWIRARLTQHPSEKTCHPILDEALTTNQAYVEYFGSVDFMAGERNLFYAYRVESHDGEVLGVLALTFRLEDEMKGIFGKLSDSGDCTVLATVDDAGLVVASSSAIQLPPGIILESELRSASGNLVRFAGREYLAFACPAEAYQGYPGPGWLGLGLLPVEFAFAHDEANIQGDVDPAALHAVSHHPGLFSEALRGIPAKAERIQADLNRSVWNGSVRQVDTAGGNATFAKTLLWEISNTGRKTQAVFEQSIGNLQRTVIAALLQSGVSRASFAIDVMDRNLYERANDCRWWARNATFRRVLEQGAYGKHSQECSEVLSHINDLYTVYDLLFLFDQNGVVMAVSRTNHSDLLGTRLQEEWVGRCLSIDEAQGYVVSGFVPTHIYNQQHTYIYAAAVRSTDDNRVVGGIGIVFDSHPQFEAMLTNALPLLPSGAKVEGAFALFIQPDGRIVAGSDARFSAGCHFECAGIPRGLAAGEQRASVVAWEGQYYALGVAKSAGYREFKTCDGYREDVLAVCAFPLGSVSAKLSVSSSHHHSGAVSRARRLGSGPTVELATFYIGGQWLALPVSEVVEAIDATGITPAIGSGNEMVIGVKMIRGHLISVLSLQRLLGGGVSAHTASQPIIVVRTHDKECLGLLVDALGEIPEVATEAIQPMTHLASGPGVLTVGVVHGLGEENDRHAVLSVLSAERLCARLGCHCPSDPSASRASLHRLA